MDEHEEFAFSTHEDVVKVVRSMEHDLFQIVPKVIWAAQTDQLSTAVRNHIEMIGYTTDDKVLLYGMLYGTLLTINLESQTMEVSPASIMLASVLLNMTEDPNLDRDQMEMLRKEVDKVAALPRQRKNGTIKRLIRRVADALLASIGG
jgi:hypothetical protein